jgi:hypothetical protein
MSVQALIQSISTFAVNNSNPVLSILPESGAVEYDHKYPEPILSFSGAGLRAYYHCHSWSSPPAGEHGHFHIFVRAPDENWTHLAGLSMDRQGQPLQWFTVNHWVTGEHWRESTEIIAALDTITVGEDWLLIEQWLGNMVEFYRPVLATLLAERDAQLSKLALHKERQELMQDRDIYILSHQNIDLFHDISCQTERLVESHT